MQFIRVYQIRLDYVQTINDKHQDNMFCIQRQCIIGSCCMKLTNEAELRIYAPVNYTIIDWFRKWIVACSATTHYPSQWRFIINWTLRNIFQWNFTWNSKVFIQKDVYKHVFLKKWRPSCLSLNVLNHSLISNCKNSGNFAYEYQY